MAEYYEIFEDRIQELQESIYQMKDLARCCLEDINEWTIDEDNIVNDRINRAREVIGYCDQLEKTRLHLDKAAELFSEVRRGLIGDGDSLRVSTQGQLREIHITVTEGMLKNSMLTVSKGVRNGLLSIGEKLHIESEGLDNFTTNIAEPGNRLRERKKIREFYEKHDFRAEDSVILREFEKGKWKMIPDTIATKAGKILEDLEPNKGKEND